MTVYIGYLPTAEGDAAFHAALDEAKHRYETPGLCGGLVYQPGQYQAAICPGRSK